MYYTISISNLKYGKVYGDDIWYNTREKCERRLEELKKLKVRSTPADMMRYEIVEIDWKFDDTMEQYVR